jgi:hypothetical protein
LRRDPYREVAFKKDVINGLLKQPEVRLVLQARANGVPIESAVGLRARRAYCWPLGRVQGAKLNARLVGGQGHRTIQRVDLLDEMSLADAPD